MKTPSLIGDAILPRRPCKVWPESVQRVARAGRKPDFWPVSKFNTGSLPFRGILPVKNVRQLYASGLYAKNMPVMGMDDTTETRSATCYVYRMDVIRASHKIGDPGSLTRIEKCFSATCVSYPELGIGQFRKKQPNPSHFWTRPNQTHWSFHLTHPNRHRPAAWWVYNRNIYTRTVL